MKLTWIFLLSVVLVYLYMSQPADSWRRFRVRVRVRRVVRRVTSTVRRVVRRITPRIRIRLPRIRLRLRRVIKKIKAIVKKPSEDKVEIDHVVTEKCVPICLIKSPKKCQDYWCSNEWVCPTTCKLFKDDEVSILVVISIMT